MESGVRNHQLIEYIKAYQAKEEGIEFIEWSEADLKEARAAGFATWDSMAALSPRCARLVESVKVQARGLGKID